MEIENPGAAESKSLAGGSKEMNRRMEDCFPFLQSLALDPPPSCRIAAVGGGGGVGGAPKELKQKFLQWLIFPFPSLSSVDFRVGGLPPQSNKLRSSLHLGFDEVPGPVSPPSAAAATLA